MYNAQDYLSGYGQKKEKPYNSILPYLKAKAEKAEADKQPASSKAEQGEESYTDAIHSIITEE